MLNRSYCSTTISHTFGTTVVEVNSTLDIFWERNDEKELKVLASTWTCTCIIAGPKTDYKDICALINNKIQ